MQWLINNSDLCMVLTSFCSVLLSIVAIVISIIVCVSQNKFNSNSVKPYCNILFYALKDELYINIQNSGIGVMIINNIIFSLNGVHYETISEIISKEKVKTCQEINICGTGIAPSGENTIFKLSFAKQKDLLKVHKKLADLKIMVHYEDIYERKYSQTLNLKDEYEIYLKALHGRKMEVFK